MTPFFVPGRLCLFGEHSDWAGGYRRTHPEIARGVCLVAGTDQGLTARAEADPAVVEITSHLPSGEEIGPARIAATPGELDAAARSADFFSYVAGAAAEVMARHVVGGLRLRVVSDLPVRKGLSSSAAISVATVRAYARVYGLDLGVREEMEIAYRGERRTGSECGRMDQACAHGRTVSRLTFDGDALEVAPVVPGGVLHLLIVDLRRAKDTRRILADLNACFPDAPGRRAAAVRHALGAANLAVTARAAAAIAGGDAVALGACMTEAQHRFDADVAPACSELEAPALHALLAHPAVAELGTGAKGVGSQGDGCGQIVARDAEAREALAARLVADLGVRTYGLTLFPGSDA